MFAVGRLGSPKIRCTYPQHEGQPDDTVRTLANNGRIERDYYKRRERAFRSGDVSLSRQSLDSNSRVCPAPQCLIRPQL